MRIKKTSETTPRTSQTVNSYSESTQDSYSCDYVNNIMEDFLNLALQNIRPILYKGILFNLDGLTTNTYSLKFENGEYVSAGNNNGKGVYITNSTGSAKTFVVGLTFESSSESNYYTQYGYGTGILPNMISTGAGREQYTSEFNSANTYIEKTYVVPNGKKFFLGSGLEDLPHIKKIICY